MNDSETVKGVRPGERDHTTRPEFFTHYSQKTSTATGSAAFIAVRDMVLRFLGPRDGRRLAVADIGCGNGGQSLVWAELGHRLHALDISADLLALARRRAEAAGRVIDFQLGSATQTPWTAGSMDVCLVLELLEHVVDWQACLDEFTRLVKPGGILVLSTTNVLCPVQQEFSLPLYSWYPGPLKRYCERLALTTRPQIAAYATYPAVNWFSFYSLRRELARRGFQSFDRFDLMDLEGKGSVGAGLVRVMRRVGLLRWLGHVATPYTIALAVKRA